MCRDALSEIEPHTCDKCGKDCEELVGKGPYNGNTDTGNYCKDCFKIIFNEEWED